MDALRLIELIKSPETVNQVDISDLKGLIERHPFFSIGHLLYLNGLKKTDLDSFGLELNRSAVRIADRGVLYQLVKQVHLVDEEIVGFQDADLPVTEISKTSDIETVSTEELLEIDEPETFKRDTFVEMKNLGQDPEEVLVTEMNLLEQSIQEPQEEISISSPIEEVPQELSTKQEPQLKHISLDDIFAGTHDDIDEDVEISEQAAEELIPVGITEEHLTEIKETTASDHQSEESPLIPVIESESPIFLADLQDNPSETASESVSQPSEVAFSSQTEISEGLPSKKMNLGSFNSWLKQHIQEKNQAVPEEEPVKFDEKAIIDKFIKVEPKMSKPKAEFFNPIESSKLSVVDNESIVSETLAKVYADQGDYDKAISAYKILSLEKPEKSTYFAALIYELELKQSLE